MASNPNRIPLLCLGLAVLILFFGGRIVLHSCVSFQSSASQTTDIATSVNADLTIYYLERPPYYVTGPLGVYGVCVDPVKAALRQAGITAVWRRLPARRQLESIRANRRKIAAVGWFKTPERERFARFSSPIHQDKPLIALTLAANRKLHEPISLKTLLADRKLILLKKNGYSYGPRIDLLLSLLKPRIVTTDSRNLQMLAMIHSGRADYFFISEEEAEILTSTSGLLRSDFKFVHFSDPPAGNRRYLMFSRQVEESLIDRFDTALQQVLGLPRDRD